MNGRVIDHPDDLVRGKYVTVVGWRKKLPARQAGVDMWGFPRGGGGEPTERQDYFGSVFRVEAVSLPMLMVRDIEGKQSCLDLRDAMLSPLSPQFVRAWQAEWRKRQKAKKDAPPSPPRARLSASLGRLYDSLALGGSITPVHEDTPDADEGDDEDDDA